MRKVTHGGVSGSAKDDVDKQRIKGGVETKNRRNSHKHGIGHSWKKKSIHIFQFTFFLVGFLKTELMELFDFLSFSFFFFQFKCLAIPQGYMERPLKS